MLSIVVAAENKRGIGYQGRIPWHIPEDLKNFKRLTLYNAVIMGRNTWVSIGRELPNRLNIVVSGSGVNGMYVVKSLSEALDLARKYQVYPFVIGGERLFHEAYPVAERIYYTRVLGDFVCDRFFPVIDDRFQIIYESEIKKERDIEYMFVIYENKDLKNEKKNINSNFF